MSVLPEPDTGKPLNPNWSALDTAMRADSAAEPLADLIKAMIEEPTNLPAWQLERANLAVSEATIRALGRAPVDLTETGEAAVLEEVVYSGVNTVEPPEGLP